MSDLSVKVPAEPPNGSVVLGGVGVTAVPRVWQRIDAADVHGRWVQAGGHFGLFTGVAYKTWPHLVVDEPSLSLLYSAPEQLEGWRDAGFADSGCQSFAGPSDVDAPSDGWSSAGFASPACRSFAAA